MQEYNKHTTSSSPAQGSDPAASMSLLTSLLNNPLDVGYESYDDTQHPKHWWHRPIAFVFTLALGFMLTIAVMSLRTAQDADITQSLRDQAQSSQSVVASLQDNVQSLSTRVSQAASSTAPQVLVDPSDALTNAMEPVVGPGITVTVKDSSLAKTLTQGSRGQVRDIDLNVIVNALWAEGAEAISINDLRIGPGTFIRTAGSAILVNVTPVESPYEVRAIGDANTLSVGLVRGSTGDFLSTAKSMNGIEISAAGTAEIQMPALNVRTPQYAVASNSQGE